MVFISQVLRSSRLFKAVLVSRQPHLECLSRWASTATAMTVNRIPSKISVGLFPPTLEKKTDTSEATSAGSESSLGHQRLSNFPQTPTFFRSPVFLSSRLITDCILPGSDFIVGRGAIYTVPLGYRRAHLEKIIGDGPIKGPVVKKDPNVHRDSAVNEPPVGRVIEKQAARLIKIRRKKMKKHKLRKLRKKMHFLWAKVRMRREARKRKIFENELLTRMNLADEFDAEAWVLEFLRKATTDPATLIKKTPMPIRPTRYVLD